MFTNQRNMASVIALTTLIALAPVGTASAQEEITLEMQDDTSQTTEMSVEMDTGELADTAVEAETETSAEAEAEVEADGNPYIKEIESKATALAQKLTAEQSADLAKLRTAFGMIESVDMVHSHVGKAVNSCAENYPDMADSIQSQFDTWEKRVLPSAEHHAGILNTAVNDGRFDNPGEVTEYFETIDKAAEFTDSRLVRDPVITEQTCQGLTASMKNTKEELVSLMRDIDWPSGVDATPMPDPSELVGADESEAQTEEVPSEQVQPDAQIEAQTETQTDEDLTVEDEISEQPMEEEAPVVSDEELEFEPDVPSEDENEPLLDTLEETNPEGTTEQEPAEDEQSSVQPEDNQEIEVEVDTTANTGTSVSEAEMLKAVQQMEKQNMENAMRSENEMMEQQIKQDLQASSGSTASE